MIFLPFIFTLVGIFFFAFVANYALERIDNVVEKKVAKELGNKQMKAINPPQISYV